MNAVSTPAPPARPILRRPKEPLINVVYCALSRTSTLTAVVLWATVPAWPATTRHVWSDSPAPATPYADWATAAHVIQDAVDAAAAGELVLVTNGVYATGGRAVGTNILVNRVAVDKPLQLTSVNGPQVTIIQGAKAPGGGIGDGAVRCAYLADGVTLSGFTLTGGDTRRDGDWERSSGGGAWCTSTNAVLTHCVLTGNSAAYAGGVSGGTLYNCTLTGNWADYGGGAYGGTLYSCTLTGNSAEESGGGAVDGTLNNCTLAGNSARWGGGTARSTLYNCTLTGNSAEHGGGVWLGTLANCTLTGNWADYGGGAYGGTLHNCLVYFNTAPNGPNWSEDWEGEAPQFAHSCTTPLPPGPGNTDTDPLLASATHLAAQSPCIGRGNSAYSRGVDLDGEDWLNPPCIGADQFVAGAATGPQTVAITASYTNVATGFTVSFVADNTGPITGTAWDFGDGVVVSNRPYASHAWASPGLYPVRLTGYNDSHPEGVSATVRVEVGAREVYYVNGTNTSPVPPYTDRAGAAVTIQEAIDAGTQIGRLVLVGDGVYASGGRAVVGTMTNRAVVPAGVEVSSEHGPLVTVIAGQPAPNPQDDWGNGDGAIRCVYVGTNAVLSGFTLTNGHTRQGSENSERSGGGARCERSGVLTNCVLTGNSAGGGGGVWGGALSHCVLTGNTATGEWGSGGGAAGATLSNCSLTDNSARLGGGAADSTLSNCTLTGNSADSGGGADGGTLCACVLTGNSAREGGGASDSTLNNCTLTGNSAEYGGGTYGGTLNNCIVWFNSAPADANYSGGTLDYCCTTPLPAEGRGNLSLDPQLASTSHLSVGSPCRGAGSLAYATGVDLDGEAWATLPAIGCDEYHAGTATGPLSVSTVATFTNVVVAYPVTLTGLIEGRATASVWDFGDGATASNQPYTAHAWSAPGDYAVVLRAYNASQPEGVSATVTVRVLVAAVHYVATDSPQPQAPYTSWATAATNLQDAVDAAEAGDRVLVTNGTYAGGVRVTKPLALRSVNGPGATVITGEGGGGRCVYLASGASLTGFTVNKGSVGHEERGGGVYAQSEAAVITDCVLSDNSGYYGGGVSGGTLNHCTLTGNSAWKGGGAAGSMLNNCTVAGNTAILVGGVDGGTLIHCTVSGNQAEYGGGGVVGATLFNCLVSGNYARRGGTGGAGGCTLNNCVLTSNSAGRGDGGGASDCILNNCTVVGNSASQTMGGSASGGGTLGGTLSNCILYENRVYNGPFEILANDEAGSTLNNCYTTPLPTAGVAIFVDVAGGNLRLSPDSPCINAGNNASASGTTDLDGRPRIVGGSVDMGAYEFQPDVPGRFIAWLQHYSLPTDGSADFADPDTDGLDTWQEWRCLTDPTNALSVLRLLSATPAGDHVTVSWPGVESVPYFLERSLDLGASPSFTPLATNLFGPTGPHTFTDTNAAAAASGFYRVGVGP